MKIHFCLVLMTETWQLPASQIVSHIVTQIHTFNMRRQKNTLSFVFQC